MMVKFRDLVNSIILNEAKWIGFFGDSEYKNEYGKIVMGYWVLNEIIDNYENEYGRVPYTLDSEISEEELFNNSDNDVYVIKNDNGVICGIRLIYHDNRNKIEETINGIHSENDMLVFRVEDEYYLTELLEDYNKNYIHKHFNDKNDEIWIYKKDLKGNLLREIGDIGRTWVCKKCNCEVVFDKDLVSENYEFVCLNCDEDLYDFEIDLIPNERVMRFINGEDKEYYKKHLCLP